MNHETNDFAAWRSARRTSDSPARSAYAIEKHVKPRDGWSLANRLIAAGLLAYLLAVFFHIL